MRPLIGITTYERNGAGDFLLPGLYADAVRRAGGIPLLLPHGEPHLPDLMTRLDALILSGGADIDPSYYGGAAHPRIEKSDRERDESELAWVHQALPARLPLLGICRGSQLLNVALGGTLIEHLPDAVGEQVVHQTERGGVTHHPVTVVPGTRLAAILHGEAGEPASWHHQAVRRLAPPLVVAATAPDGTIEAFEMPDHPWLLGVQWHPEITAATDPAQQRLFDALVAAAREFRRSRF